MAAVLGGPGEGTAYGSGTAANAAVTSASADGESVHVVGDSTATQTAHTLAAGFWASGGSLANSAGPLIEVLESGGVQPARVTIVNNHGRQHMPSSGIVLTSVSHALVRGNQLHCFHSGSAGNGISHRATSGSDQVHVHGNHLMTHGTGRWTHGVQLSEAANLGHSSVCDNAIHGANIGIRYAGGPPAAIPTVAGNRVSGAPGGALVLPSPTCTGGNLGGVAQYEGAGAPSFAAARGSLYVRTDGAVGSGGAAGTLRYVNATGADTWVALIDG